MNQQIENFGFSAVFLGASLVFYTKAVRAKRNKFGRVKPGGVIPRMIVVGDEDLMALSLKLEGFRKGLSADENNAFNQLFLRAKGSPVDNPAGVNINKLFFTAGLQTEGGNRDIYSIIIQGGRGRSRYGITQSPVEVLREALGIGAVSIGPKQDDPRVPTIILAGKMHTFSNHLSVSEKGMMDWLIQRAITNSANSSTEPGDLQPSPIEVLRAALGIKSIGPKQDDPRTPPIDQHWALLF